MKSWMWVVVSVLNFGVGLWAIWWPLILSARWFGVFSIVLSGVCAGLAWRAKREALT